MGSDPDASQDSASDDLPDASGESIWSDDGIGSDGIEEGRFTEPSWTDRVPGWMVWFRRGFFLAVVAALGLMLADDTKSTTEGAPFGSTGATGIGILMATFVATGLVALVWPHYVYFAGFRFGYRTSNPREPTMRHLLVTRFVLGPTFLFGALVCGFMLSAIARDVPA